MELGYKLSLSVAKLHDLHNTCILAVNKFLWLVANISIMSMHMLKKKQDHLETVSIDV
jgi:hypothetical protein